MCVYIYAYSSCHFAWRTEDTRASCTFETYTKNVKIFTYSCCPCVWPTETYEVAYIIFCLSRMKAIAHHVPHRAHVVYSRSALSLANHVARSAHNEAHHLVLHVMLHNILRCKSTLFRCAKNVAHHRCARSAAHHLALHHLALHIMMISLWKECGTPSCSAPSCSAHNDYLALKRMWHTIALRIVWHTLFSRFHFLWENFHAKGDCGISVGPGKIHKWLLSRKETAWWGSTYLYFDGHWQFINNKSI